MNSPRAPRQGHVWKLRLAADGSVTVPADVLEELGAVEGGELLFVRRSDGYLLTSHQRAIQNAKELFAPIRDPSAVDELINGRREEAATGQIGIVGEEE